MDELDAKGSFKALDGASPQVQAHVRGMVLQSHIDGGLRTVGDVLVTTTDRWMSEEAATLLDRIEDKPKPTARAGEIQVSIAEVTWPGPNEPGEGAITVGTHTWNYKDFRDRLPLNEENGQEMRDQLGLDAGEEAEARQCELLNIIGAVLWSQRGSPPTLQEVQTRALQERMGIWEKAVELVGALGPMPAKMTRTEADPRVYAHDALAPHHDKDFRFVTALRMDALNGIILHVLLVDYLGRVREEIVHDDTTLHSDKTHAWIMIHRMHARAVNPPKGWETIRPWRPGAVHDAPGWESLLERSLEEDPTECGSQLAHGSRCLTDKRQAESREDQTSWRRSGSKATRPPNDLEVRRRPADLRRASRQGRSVHANLRRGACG